MADEEKVVVKREVEAYLEPDPATSVFTPEDLGLEEDQTLAEWVEESGDDAYEGAKDLDLFLNPTIHLSVRETYEDGTSAVVDTFVWKDHE